MSNRGQRGRRRSSDSPERQTDRLIGARLGQYHIVGLLGVGGMGEVWRAEDTRLGRTVALKMLPEELAGDPERLERFAREAKVLASLDHPNLAILYGLEHLEPSADGESPESHRGVPGAGVDQRSPSMDALVMELVEGDGLDEIIARGPLEFTEAMAIAFQIAEGLGAAHEAGIVHRDLKPANIKVRPDGRVKILDFGLATSRRSDGTVNDQSQSQSPTMTRHHPTAVGSILGTVAYMSPEQARGKRMDRRSDIWSFGCLLYEMLTAAPAFPGETLSDTMASVLKDDPEWTLLPHDLEPVARHVLRRCLSKDPARRFHDIADVRIELEEALTTPDPHPGEPARSQGPIARWLVLGAVAAAIIFLGVAVTLRPLPTSMPAFRALSFRSGRVASARFAPDGTTVIFGTSTRERRLAVFSTRTDSVESRPMELPPADILGITDTGQMALLLDRHREGSWISVGTLAIADLAGGAPRPLLDRVNDGDISPDGTKFAVVREQGRLQQLEYPVGTTLFQTSGWISHVRISPDGTRVAFLHHPYYGDDRGLAAMVDAHGDYVPLTADTSNSLQGLAWSPRGEAVWYSVFAFKEGGEVWSVVPGSAPVLRLRSPISVRLQDIAPDGRVLVVAGDTRAEVAGLLAGQTGERRYESWNDDSIGGMNYEGTLFAGNLQVATVDGEYAAFVRAADGSPPLRIGQGDVFGMSPDGSRVFVRKLTRDRDRLVLLPTGPGTKRIIDLHGVRPDDSARGSLTCSADGRFAAFAGVSEDHGARIFVVNLVDDSLQEVGPEGTGQPVISPTGDRVAAVGPDGRVTVYPVSGGQPLPVAAARTGERPLQWTRDGRAVLVWDRSFPAHIERLDLDDGSRRLLRTIMPENPAGVLYGQILLSPGGGHYVYRYRRDASTLFVVENLMGNS